MNDRFVILEFFQHEVSCCCPGQKHQHLIEFHQGDVWTITNERKYVDCLGWHFLVTVNGEFRFLMHVEDMEDLYNNGSICSVLDLELKTIHLNFKINEALDAHDKESFLLFANELTNLREIKDKMHAEGVQVF
ncbi:hypothetical protein [Psychrobacillus soli]|uniref:IDEAL domain-containing protein n=1 Tax=Psychrobacillus soli TaxID=1543965 RepID=A0A544T4D8_9BACI|nr:hypothetical protein [Psychrobacillus soli]TQR12301.1 hypothetical protein FG383_13580 [Psychrobacillus soli]